MKTILLYSAHPWHTPQPGTATTRARSTSWWTGATGRATTCTCGSHPSPPAGTIMCSLTWACHELCPCCGYGTTISRASTRTAAPGTWRYVYECVMIVMYFLCTTHIHARAPRTHTHTLTHTHTYTLTTYLHTCICTQTQTHTQKRTHMHTHAHTCTHTHTHTHERILCMQALLDERPVFKTEIRKASSLIPNP
jgi:hypothetical protein